jgi:hypothetical protein
VETATSFGTDPYDVFLGTAALEVPQIHARSRVVRLIPAPGAGNPPAAYNAVFAGIEHFEPVPGGTVRVTSCDVPVKITFPLDYLRSTDPSLQFRVVRVLGPLLHPNHRDDGTLCLGPAFHPGSRLASIVEQVYGIVSGRIAATAHGLDRAACDYYLAHPAEVRALQAEPLWRVKVAASVRVEEVA